MNSQQHPVTLNPVGYVKTDTQDNEVKDKTHLSQIVLRSQYVEALDGLTGFSHVYVLFWLSEISPEQRKIKKVHPRGRKDLPLVGVFATRTNLRSNPIGLTLVELVKVEGNVLTVRGLDAFDGTPVLDIKPFDFWDIAKDAKVPEWWLKLEEEKQRKP
jgi:tRNA-Thr(GGU) m(6)t(6)A37 methyltransferase TsaA